MGDDVWAGAGTCWPGAAPIEPPGRTAAPQTAATASSFGTRRNNGDRRCIFEESDPLSERRAYARGLPRTHDLQGNCGGVSRRAWGRPTRERTIDVTSTGRDQDMNSQMPTSSFRTGIGASE